jgi:hypothetical protein
MPNSISAIMIEFMTVVIKHAEKRSKSEAERIFSVSEAVHLELEISGTEIKACQFYMKTAISMD